MEALGHRQECTLAKIVKPILFYFNEMNMIQARIKAGFSVYFFLVVLHWLAISDWDVKYHCVKKGRLVLSIY